MNLSIIKSAPTREDDLKILEGTNNIYSIKTFLEKKLFKHNDAFREKYKFRRDNLIRVIRCLRDYLIGHD